MNLRADIRGRLPANPSDFVDDHDQTSCEDWQERALRPASRGNQPLLLESAVVGRCRGNSCSARVPRSCPVGCTRRGSSCPWLVAVTGTARLASLGVISRKWSNSDRTYLRRRRTQCPLRASGDQISLSGAACREVGDLS